MTKQQVLGVVFRIIQQQAELNTMAAVGALTFSPAQSMQGQANEAAEAWLFKDNDEPIRGVVSLMCTMDLVTKHEADELLEAISKVKKDGKE